MLRRRKRICRSACSVQTPHGPLAFALTRSSGRRTAVISINEEAAVHVRTPFSTPEREVLAFVRRKAAWILAKVTEMNARRARAVRRRFADGETFPFLGAHYSLKVRDAHLKRARIRFAEGCWEVLLPQETSAGAREAQVKAKLLQWYRREAKEVVGARIFHYARVMGVEPRRVAVRTQKRLWGNCHVQAQAIYLNWQIVLFPPQVLDYVVVHELCHLRVPDHSRKFWREVEKYMPEFDRHRRWLREHAPQWTLT